jgi:hypothetical protein
MQSSGRSIFNEDWMGELYVADLGGTLYRIQGETFCDVAPGNLKIANFSGKSAAVEVEIRGEASRVALGSFVIAAGSGVDAGPVAISSGDYALSCRFLDPATGERRSETRAPFHVE